MADLLIKNLPAELCCGFRALSEVDRRIVVSALANAVERLSRTPPTLDEMRDFHRRQRELHDAGLLKPITPELIEEATSLGCRC